MQINKTIRELVLKFEGVSYQYMLTRINVILVLNTAVNGNDTKWRLQILILWLWYCLICSQNATSPLVMHMFIQYKQALMDLLDSDLWA